MNAHDDFDADHSTSPTGHVVEALELYGYRPAEDEADPRITPEDDVIRTAVADIFDALISTMADTSLDFDLDEIRSGDYDPVTPVLVAWQRQRRPLCSWTAAPARYSRRRSSARPRPWLCPR